MQVLSQDCITELKLCRTIVHLMLGSILKMNILNEIFSDLASVQFNCSMAHFY
jgi:hypothetical protein